MRFTVFPWMLHLSARPMEKCEFRDDIYAVTIQWLGEPANRHSDGLKLGMRDA